MKTLRLFGFIAFCLVFAVFFGATSTEDISDAVLTFQRILQQQVAALGGAQLTATETSLAEVDANGIVEQAAPAVVQISEYREVPAYSYRNRRTGRRVTSDFLMRQKVSSGSGFFVTSDGYILTNKHVVSETDGEYTVNTGEKEYPASVIYRDPVQDIAVLKVDGTDFPSLAVGDSSALRTGESVVAIGNALGRFTDSVATGRVLGLNRSVVVRGDDRVIERIRGLIEVDAQFYPGDSGGPLIDPDGKVVGVNVATASGASLSYSIPMDTAKHVLENAGVKL